MIVLDHSALHVYRMCPRRYYWTYRRNLDPGRSDAMERGRAVHEGLYVWAKTRNAEQAVEAVRIERPEGMLPQEEPKYAEMERAAKELLRGYIQQLGATEDFEIEAVELPLRRRVNDIADYVGVIDAIIKHPVLGRYVHEYKTTGVIYDNWAGRLQLDSQTVGYVWLVKGLGIDVRGVLLSLLRATKYPEYVRDVVQTPDWLLREFEVELSDTAWEIWELTRKEQMYTTPELVWRKNTQSCFAYNQKCPFHTLCAEAPGVREQLVRDGFYRQRENRELKILERALGRKGHA
jgi:hypothetical protein